MRVVFWFSRRERGSAGLNFCAYSSRSSKAGSSVLESRVYSECGSQCPIFVIISPSSENSTRTQMNEVRWRAPSRCAACPGSGADAQTTPGC